MGMDPDFTDVQVKKKSKTFLTIFLTIIIMLIVQAGGYYIYKEYFKEKEEVIEEKDEEEAIAPILEITASEQIAIFYKLDDYLFFAKSFPISNVEVLDSQDLLRFALYKLEGNSSDLTKSNVEATINTYFGEVPNLVFADVKCFVDSEKDPLYKYDEENQKFIAYGDHGHGGEARFFADFEYISGTKQGDEFTIIVKALYFEPCETCGPSTTVFATPQDAFNKTNKILTIKDKETGELSETERTEALEKVPETVFVFRKVKNNFVLEKMMIEE